MYKLKTSARSSRKALEISTTPSRLKTNSLSEAFIFVLVAIIHLFFRSKPQSLLCFEYAATMVVRRPDIVDFWANSFAGGPATTFGVLSSRAEGLPEAGHQDHVVLRDWFQ